MPDRRLWLDMKSTTHIHEEATATVEALLDQHRKLVEALRGVLRMHYDNDPREQMLAAMDRLIECTRLSFQQATDLKAHLGTAPNAASLAEQDYILDQMSSVREQVECSDHSHLLAHLAFVDYWLTTHISDEMLSVLYQRMEPIAGTEMPIAGNARLHKETTAF